MNTRILAPVILAFLLGSGGALAADSKVTISSPANGVTVSPHDSVELAFDAIPGSDGDHLHLYLDGKKLDVIHQMKGTAKVGMLDVGKHHICLTVNTKSHAPTGAEACVDVTSK